MKWTGVMEFGAESRGRGFLFDFFRCREPLQIGEEIGVGEGLASIVQSHLARVSGGETLSGDDLLAWFIRLTIFAPIRARIAFTAP